MILKSISFKNDMKNSEMSKIYMILPRFICKHTASKMPQSQLFKEYKIIIWNFEGIGKNFLHIWDHAHLKKYYVFRKFTQKVFQDRAFDIPELSLFMQQKLLSSAKVFQNRVFHNAMQFLLYLTSNTVK